MPDIKLNRLGLNDRQTALLVVIGAALWALAAIILRNVAPMGALEGFARAVTYVLIIPGTLPFIWLTRNVAKLHHGQTFTGVAVVTATALLIDGIVVAWLPAIYSSTLPQVANCAATILWGAGVGLVLASILNSEEAA